MQTFPFSSPPVTTTKTGAQPQPSLPATTTTTSPSLDLIIGSELVYSNETALACANCIQSLLQQCPQALVVLVQCTERPGWSTFLQQLRKGHEPPQQRPRRPPPPPETRVTAAVTKQEEAAVPPDMVVQKNEMNLVTLQVEEYVLSDPTCHDMAACMVPMGGTLNPRFDFSVCYISTTY